MLKRYIREIWIWDNITVNNRVSNFVAVYTGYVVTEHERNKNIGQYDS